MLKILHFTLSVRTQLLCAGCDLEKGNCVLHDVPAQSCQCPISVQIKTAYKNFVLSSVTSCTIYFLHASGLGRKPLTEGIVTT